ncbi:MAG: glycosyltransferase family 4 protein [Solirubrobacteraceae bacterium]
MRIAWLLGGINRNHDRCLSALADLGVEQFVAYQKTMLDTAFENSGYCAYARRLIWDREAPGFDELSRILGEFRPDAIVTGGWSGPAGYRKTMRSLSSGVVRVMAMDNTWHGTVKQWIGRGVHRIYIDPLFDCVAVPSDRTEWFARRLGFAAEDVIRGNYVGDTELFDRGPRAGEDLQSQCAFLFAGRLVPDKAIDLLAEAYRRYRVSVDAPWDLHIVGSGPQQGLLEGIPGVILHGFLQPPELADLMQRSSCLVLASRFEPYGVIVHEAAAAGLPLLVSDMAGAVPGLVQDGYNGWVIPRENPLQWARAMARISGLGGDRLEEMSRTSQALASRLSVRGWARNFLEELERRISNPVAGRAPALPRDLV